MKILLAENCGFCFGVEKAIEKLEELLDKQSGLPIYTFGPIIHNPQVVEKFEQKGVKIIDSVDDISEGIVVIRSHGIHPEKLKQLQEKNVKIIDATCPFVKAAQNICSLLKKEKYYILIVGEHEHPEVEALVGYAGKNSLVVKSADQVKDINLKKKVGVVSQTTQPMKILKDVIDNLDWYNFKEIRVFDTICDATTKRQESALKIAKKADIMLVIGGHSSSNTKKLAQLCHDAGVKTYHIESKNDLNKDWFINKKVVGITAGASTPSWVVDEVIKELRK